jgi:hypothetical protein
MTPQPSRLLLRCLALLACVLALPAAAQTRAWLDRDRIALGETATLNIETDEAAAAAPDYAPLLGNFELTGNTSSRQYEMVNGVGRARTLFAVALQPRRQGLLGIPALLVGGRRTQPLTLTVTAASAAPARAGDAAFIEAEADAQAPYVQQAVGYTVRLYYATPLISGQLDQDPPDGASLQRVGEDVQYQRDGAGHRYTVVERHYLLIPERSGALTIPGARFQGRGTGGFFDEVFGDGERDLHAVSPPRFLDVRPLPAGAPQPWLPLRALGLRYLATPQAARAGEALTVTVEATADGAKAPSITGTTANGEALVQVRDWGPGLRTANSRLLFKLLQSTKPGHRGLGLVTVERIARLHGGELRFESLGDGALVTLALPALTSSRG